jgi:phage-related protein
LGTQAGQQWQYLSTDVLFYTGRHIVLLHGFQKKTQKTPRREIEIAQQRMEDFIRRNEQKGGE